MDFFDSIKKFFTPEPIQPVFGLENKSPPHPQAAIYIGNHGYREGRLPENYWQTLNHIRGQQVMPNGWTGNIASGPDAHLQDFGPLDSQYRTNRLIYPDDTNLPKPSWAVRNDYQTNKFGGMPRPLFVNGVQFPPRAPIEKEPKLVEKRRVIRMNTPEEKAAYLARQNERGFTLIGEPYAPVTDTRLAPTAMLSTERVPFWGNYRAGQATAGQPFMTRAQAFRYVPQYLNDPRTLENLAVTGSRALRGVGGALVAVDAVNRRDTNFTDFYNREGREPTNAESLGLRVKSGLEPVANFATMGMYDYLADTPTYRAMMEDEARNRDIRRERQLEIDYPIIFGNGRGERTTK
jgi:hypothetical protein